MEQGAQESTAFRETMRDLLHVVIVHETGPHAPMRIEAQGKLF